MPHSVAESHLFVPVSEMKLVALLDSGALDIGGIEGYAANASDEDATYDALASADDDSADRLVIEVEGEPSTVTVDDVVAIYKELAWYGVQELGELLGRSR